MSFAERLSSLGSGKWSLEPQEFTSCSQKTFWISVTENYLRNHPNFLISRLDILRDHELQCSLRASHVRANVQKRLAFFLPDQLLQKKSGHHPLSDLHPNPAHFCDGEGIPPPKYVGNTRGGNGKMEGMEGEGTMDNIKMRKGKQWNAWNGMAQRERERESSADGRHPWGAKMLKSERHPWLTET